MTKITRVELIDRTKSVEEGGGRVYVNHNVQDAWVDIQDNGATLKVFMNEKPPRQWTTVEFIAEHIPASKQHLEQILTNHLRPKGVKIVDGVIVL